MKKGLFLFIACLLIIIPLSVHASYDFSKYNVRKEYNDKKYNELKNTNSNSINMFTDIYLRDMYETNYKGMTVSQQKKINDLANRILNDSSYTCNNSDSDDLCKLRKFHDWIKENFYYYRGDEVAKLGLSIDTYDNPYYILTKNKILGKTSYLNIGETEPVEESDANYISRCNGYTSVLIALARNEGIPARAVSGYYNTLDGTRAYSHDSDKKWNRNPVENTLSHAWVTAFVDNKWIIIDANADSYNSYRMNRGCSYNFDGLWHSVAPSTYVTEDECISNEYAWTNWVTSQKSYADKYNDKYFNVSSADLSDSHIIFKYRAGSKDLKFLSNTSEMAKLKAFLNRKTNGITNGKRINSSYSTSNPATWFIKGDTKSLGDGYGRLYKLYWPTYKKLWGRLTLSGFSSLQNVSVPNNRLTSLYMENCPSLSTVAASNNKLTKVVVTGSKKLTLLSIQGNPTTYVKYNFATAPKTAIIKANKGGTISVKYSKINGKYVHTMRVFSKKGYKFNGWYKGKKRISKNVRLTVKKNTSFIYTAKFVRK